MDFEAINRLRLKEAFGEFELFQQISKDEDWLDKLFECDTRGQLFVYDDADSQTDVRNLSPAIFVKLRDMHMGDSPRLELFIRNHSFNLCDSCSEKKNQSCRVTFREIYINRCDTQKTI